MDRRSFFFVRRLCVRVTLDSEELESEDSDPLLDEDSEEDEAEMESLRGR